MSFSAQVRRRRGVAVRLLSSGVVPRVPRVIPGNTSLPLELQIGSRGSRVVPCTLTQGAPIGLVESPGAPT